MTISQPGHPAGLPPRPGEQPGEQLRDRRLARLARDTVKAASSAKLTIRGCPLGPEKPVMGLDADNGWPVFWCDLESGMAVAAQQGRAAVLNVCGPADAAERVTVLLAGQLELIGRSWERGRQVAAVMLVPAQVLVETRAAGQPAVSRAVAVQEYADAEPSGLADRAAQIAGHANAAHGDLLRHMVAARAGLPAEQVAAAWLTGLGPDGADVGWVDAAGAHAMSARFPRRARTATELALLLREQLTAG